MCINKTDNIQNSGNDKLEKMRKVYNWFTCRKIVKIYILKKFKNRFPYFLISWSF